MNVRKARPEDHYAFDLTLTAMLSDDDFTVDGFAGSWALAAQHAVSVGWFDSEERAHEAVLITKDQTTSNLVLSSLGTELSLQALVALGFRLIM